MNHNFSSSCKLLVVGGGTGGCAIASKFSKILKKHELIILEPSEDHYYQPLFSLIGAGLSDLDKAKRPMSQVLPKNSTWVQQKAVQIDPKEQFVQTSDGSKIKYDFLVLATGLVLNYSEIPGLVRALEMPTSGVCSNYSPDYVNRMFPILNSVQSGNLIFTHPNCTIKCPGAPQRSCYFAEEFLRRKGIRQKCQIYYTTTRSDIFEVPYYARPLWSICVDRNINVELKTNLTSIEPNKNKAFFTSVDNNIISVKNYSMLHVTPPMSTPDVIKNCKELVDSKGFVNVCPKILQNEKYKTVFAIGDCASTPNMKTTSAIGAQVDIIFKNMCEMMVGQGQSCSKTFTYDGYSACPLVTGYNKCILAECDYNLRPLETFPFKQNRELASMFFLKKNVMPFVYWNGLLTGNWSGPRTYRNVMRLLTWNH